MHYYAVLFALLSSLSNAVRIRKLYDWPATNNFTGPENIAIRPCGELVITSTSDPCVYTLSPQEHLPERKIVHCFDNATATAGIAEIEFDIFAVNVGAINGASGVVGSWGVWTVDFNTPDSPTVTKLAYISQAGLLNGMTAVPGQEAILSVDSELGVVWKISTTSGQYTVAGQDTSFLPNSQSPFGVNGIHIDPSGRDLYFTNTANQTFGTAAYNSLLGTFVEFRAIATSDNGTYFDDFAVDWELKKAFVTEHANRIVSIDLQTGEKSVVVDSSRDGDVGSFQPTSLAFLPGYCVFYVTTNLNTSQIFEVQIC